MNIQNSTPFYSASFVLRVSNISTDPDPLNYPLANSVGSITANRLDYTWNAIDLKEILGPLYDRFEYFNLRLSCIQYDSGIGLYGTNNNMFSINFVASGPTWYNSNYDVASRIKNNKCIIGGVFLGLTRVPGTSYLNENFTTTIQKQPTFNFTISLQTLYGTTMTTPAGTLYPLFNFYFTISGVEFPEQDKNTQVY